MTPEKKQELSNLRRKQEISQLRLKQQNSTSFATQEEYEPPSMSTTQAAKLAGIDFFEPLIPDPLLYGSGYQDKLKSDIKRATTSRPEGVSFWENLNNNFVRREKEKEVAKRRLAGVPQNTNQTFVDSIKRGVFNPMAIVGPAKMGLATTIPKTIAKNTLAPAINTAIGAVPTTAGVATGALVQETDLAPITKDAITRLVTPLVGLGTGGIFNATASTAKKGFSRVSPSGMLADANTDSRIKSVIASEKDTLQGKVQALKDLQKVVPGIELPLASLSRDNAIVDAWVREVGTSEPVFRSNYTKAIDVIRDGVKKEMNKIEGSESIVKSGPLRRSLKKRSDNLMATEEKKLSTALEKLSVKEGRLAAKLRTDADGQTIGAAIKDSIEVKENMVRSVASKQYTKAIDEGTERGTTVPASDVSNIYRVAKGLSLDDLFATDPAVIKKVNTVWAPSVEESNTPPQYNASGQLVTQELTPPKVVSLTEFDSLKKAVNSQLNSLPKNHPNAPKLIQLKAAVQSARDNIGKIDPQFKTDYDEADNFYFKNIGLPLRAEGMKSISRSKFQDTTAKHLLNIEKAESYINFVGREQGIPVLRQAVRLGALQAKVVNDSGEIDQNKLISFVNSRKKLLDLAEMGPEFSDAKTALKTIRDSVIQHNKAYENAAVENTQGFFKALLNKDTEGVVTDMIRSPELRETYLKQINKLPANQRDLALAGIKQGFKEKADSGAGTTLDFINKHTEAAEDIYGKRHISNVRKLYEMGDLIKRMDDTVPRTTGKGQAVDPLEESSGVSITFLAGTLRNQILSKTRKAMHIVSKALTSKGAKKRNDSAGDILLSPDALEALARPPKGWGYYKSNFKQGASELGQHFAKTFFENGIPMEIKNTSRSNFEPGQTTGDTTTTNAAGGALLSSVKSVFGADAEKQRTDR